ncbi:MULTISPECIES: S1C family serine protease [Halolamina]|uniref:Serine protease, S1-C subfamily, contains C-terminal PDZ domain n=1 Tax=Halolamina pelagica TaxID=699431 RepID=A0A1I5QQG7_9EURY|nr:MULTISPECIES: trypsin-like peptidase domain-containing protein [Halolamina]NHX35495.1 PDZ domain-containing protein [Halolamina sp. R1-12]SFP48548.1 serine protease, S1-C subfamily, contains C-terminal PDZ domain [Halolamina pelagica]
MDESRRRFLAAAGAGIASLAGCTAPRNGPASGGEPFVDLYESVSPAVVRLRVYDSLGVLAEGSGWLYDDDVLVTNDHVVAGAETVRAQFANGDWVRAEVLGSDPYSDLAALSVDPPNGAAGLPLLDEQPAVGTRVAAVGAPLGLEGSLTSGVVSGVNRTISSVRNFTISGAVQTDAAVNPGNSGGPLLTLDGEVAGVITQAGAENIGFAISPALTERVIPALVETGTFEHSYLGVRILPVTPLLAEANGLESARGVYVAAVPTGSPADGVLQGGTESVTVEGSPQPTGGDVIVALDGRRVDTTGQLGTYLALETSPGDTVSVTVIRDGERRTVDVTLGTRPDPR